MNAKANYIKQRLSLRQPLKEALDVAVQMSDKLELKKDVDLVSELKKVQEFFPACADFEREFPSLCFNIATGIGKTRLMGACIAYLYLQKGVRNFFILAPNLTIYEKTIEDFGNPSGAKYVFNGISEFVHNKPVIITGDNYAQQGGLFKDDEIRINVFNIAKFNSENRGTKTGGISQPPRIKRLSEYLGQSYWDYLIGLKDLVILMDEAHRYHADSSRNAINELKPILGLELTATPIDEKGNPFKNIVYEYSLAQALTDGKYVKSPAIATRANFRPQGLTEKEIELIKLEDTINIHNLAKDNLEIYARNNNVRRVKPFILIVCKDISHAKDVFTYVTSKEFFKGEFDGKVLQIDSSVNDEENGKLLATVESLDNPIEIVIHVNMLAEGWDVTNLYTICPLRKADSIKLVEQTIGRGLRLPYGGERTGNKQVDQLTVVAHDNFDQVIAAAKDPDSVLNKMTYITLDENDLNAKTTVVSSISKVNSGIKEEETRIEEIKNPEQKQKAKNTLDAKKAILNNINGFSASQGVKRAADLSKPEVEAQVIEKIRVELGKGQLDAFSEQIVEEAKEIYQKVVSNFQSNIIEIPRMDLVLDEVKVWFEDFSLNVDDGFSLKVMDEEIIRLGLKDDTREVIGVKQGAFVKDTPVNQLISEIINYPEVDYDDNSELLHKLCKQAVDTLNEKIEDKTQLPILIRQYRKVLAGKIYDQLKAHFKMSEPIYKEPNVLPFVKIEEWNFSVLTESGYRDFREVVTPTSLITKLVFRGFAKACHFDYKFDSKTEKDFAILLESDPKIFKWLRPAPNQFRIYWANNSKQYYPDFVVETKDCLYLVETKAADQVNSAEVQDKKRAAIQYCVYATRYTTANDGKPWKYILIPHNEVLSNATFDYLVGRFEEK